MCRWSAFRGIPLPKDWPECVRVAVIESVALAHRSIMNSRSFAINSDIERVCLAGQLDSAENEIALLLEEIRIKDARMAKLAPHRRPRYAAQDRMAILKLGAARAWNLAVTARAFMVEPETIADCLKRASDASDWLLEISQPVNKYPDYVRYIIQRLKTLCPTMGKVRIAQMLARTGLRMGATTIGRILKEASLPDKPEVAAVAEEERGRVVTARYINHVWHVDMTTVPTAGFRVPGRHAVSRRSGFFACGSSWPWNITHAPSSAFRIQKAAHGGRSDSVQGQGGQRGGNGAQASHLRPREAVHLGRRFGHGAAKRPRGIKQRFGAVVENGSIAIIERLTRYMKEECTRRFPVPFRGDETRTEIAFYVDW